LNIHLKVRQLKNYSTKEDICFFPQWRRC